MKKGKLSRREFARRFAKNYGFSIEIGNELVRDIFTELADTIAEGNGVVIDGLGAFTLSDQKARDIKNPKLGVVHAEPTKLVKFTVSNELRHRVRNIPMENTTEE